MATLKGKTISETYPLLLKIASSGVDGTLRNVEDGDGTTSALQISTGAINVSGTITASGNVDFNGDLDVDGTTNLDVVDIDGAVDMASTLAVADDITLANNKYYEVKDSGGSAIRLLGLDNSNNIYMGFVDDATGTGSLYLRTGGTNALTIDNSQNATFAGDVKLLGASSYARDLTFAHGATNYYWRMGYTDASNGNTLAFINRDGGSEQEVMRMDYNKLTTFSGNVSLKGDSGKLAFLNASGTERAFLQLSSTGLVIDTDSFLEFKPNNTTAMYIDSSGNVGVGTTSPNISGWNANYAVLTIKGDTTNYGGVLELANPDSTGNYFGTVSFVNMDGGSSTVANARISGTRDGVDDASALTFETEPTGGAVTERMRITSGGNVGIHTTSPNVGAFNSERGVLTIGSTDNGSANNYANLELQGHAISNGVSVGDISFYDHTNQNAIVRGGRDSSTTTGFLSFFTNGGSGVGERMRITSDGRIGVNISSPNAKLHIDETTNGQELIFLNHSVTGANQTYIQFRHDGTQRGNIQVNDSNDQIVYNTSVSDKRLKKDFEDWDESILPAFKSLKPQLFNFKNSENKSGKSKGYIAQDNVDNFPEAYTTSKFLDDDDTEYYSFNPSGMVSYLMKAVQELTEKVEALENA